MFLVTPLTRACVRGLLLAGLGSGVVLGQGPLLDFREKRRVGFVAPEGSAWQLEQAKDGVRGWERAGGVVYGRGKTVVVEDVGGGAGYRLVPVDPAEGNALVKPGGWTALLVRGGGVASEMVFMTDGEGFYRMDAGHARGFTCEWVKTGRDVAEAVLTWTDGTRALLRVEMASRQVGRWWMEAMGDPDAIGAVGEMVDGGLLQMVEGRVVRGAVLAMPESTEGREFLFDEGGAVTALRFSDALHAEVTLPSGKGAAQGFMYERESGSRARLHSDADGVEMLLELLAPGVGVFEEVVPAQPVGGMPPMAVPRRGVFTTPVERTAVRDGDCPPPSLGDLGLVVHGSSPCTLRFNADGTGTATKEVNGSVEVTAFTWAYARTGGTGASVALTFPGVSRDLIDDYQLDFTSDCGGRFRRDSYASGSSAGVMSGTFTPAPAAR